MKEQPQLTVAEVMTSELLPYANNAKIHTREQVDQICASIEEFGFNDPIAVWCNKNNQLEIIEGHGRVMAAKKLGLETVPIIFLNHLSDEQRRAYTHVHNQLTMNTSFDFDMLAMDMNELDFDWEDFGFEPQEFDSIGAILGDDFTTLKERSEQLYFDITLTFDAEHRESVEAYMKKIGGREGLVNKIVEEAKTWE